MLAQVMYVLDVELSDEFFPLEDFFDIVSGMLSVKWDQTVPANSVSHMVVLHCLKAGYFPSLGSGGWVCCDGLYQCNWTGKIPGSVGV